MCTELRDIKAAIILADLPLKQKILKKSIDLIDTAFAFARASSNVNFNHMQANRNILVNLLTDYAQTIPMIQNLSDVTLLNKNNF